MKYFMKHEICDYLDGCDIYAAFSNLNNRFQQFLHCSSLLFKIKFHSSSDEEFMNYSEQVQFINRHQIFSLNLWSSSNINEFFSTFIIDSSFNRLESITLHLIKEKILLLLLNNLTCLPRLFSLHIEGRESLIELSEVYRLSFSLHILKYLKITLVDWFVINSLPIATKNEQFSSIQYFIIDHCCSFEQLNILISYTPELCHLSFRHEPVRESDIKMILSRRLSNLTYLSMNVTCLDYDEFILFIEKFGSNLKILHVTVQNNHAIYLASPLWERLILQHMPQLEKFYLKFFEANDEEDREGDYMWPDDQFTSSFWMERKWIFEAEIHTYEIIYSIYPHKKTWHEHSQNGVWSMTTDCPSSTITLSDIAFNGCFKTFSKAVNWISTTTTIFHLQFCQHQVLFRRLVQILNILPYLDSLKIWSVTSIKSKYLTRKEKQFIADIKKANRITKIYLENMTNVQEIFLLINLFPRLTYCQICWINDIELFVRIILKKLIKKPNHILRSLCFCNPTADDQIMEKIQKMIDLEKLIYNYRIKRVCDQIYLQWE